MNITPHTLRKTRPAWSRHKRREDGMACLIFISLLAIMMILCMAELRCLAHLHREIKFLEQQQIKRLDLVSAQAGNTAPAPGKPATP